MGLKSVPPFVVTCPILLPLPSSSMGTAIDNGAWWYMGLALLAIMVFLFISYVVFSIFLKRTCNIAYHRKLKKLREDLGQNGSRSVAPLPTNWMSYYCNYCETGPGPFKKKHKSKAALDLRFEDRGRIEGTCNEQLDSYKISGSYSLKGDPIVAWRVDYKWGALEAVGSLQCSRNATISIIGHFVTEFGTEGSVELHNLIGGVAVDMNGKTDDRAAIVSVASQTPSEDMRHPRCLERVLAACADGLLSRMSTSCTKRASEYRKQKRAALPRGVVLAPLTLEPKVRNTFPSSHQASHRDLHEESDAESISSDEDPNIIGERRQDIFDLFSDPSGSARKESRVKTEARGPARDKSGLRDDFRESSRVSSPVAYSSRDLPPTAARSGSTRKKSRAKEDLIAPASDVPYSSGLLPLSSPRSGSARNKVSAQGDSTGSFSNASDDTSAIPYSSNGSILALNYSSGTARKKSQALPPLPNRMGCTVPSGQNLEIPRVARQRNTATSNSSRESASTIALHRPRVDRGGSVRSRGDPSRGSSRGPTKSPNASPRVERVDLDLSNVASSASTSNLQSQPRSLVKV